MDQIAVTLTGLMALLAVSQQANNNFVIVTIFGITGTLIFAFILGLFLTLNN